MIMKKLIFISMALFLAVAATPAKCQMSAEREGISSKDSSTTGYMSVLKNTDRIYSVLQPMICYTDLGIGCVVTNELHSLDTVSFHGITYYKWSDDRIDFFCREDTMTGRIYRYNPNMNEEVLVCDMSLSVGDTFLFQVISDDYYGMEETHVVDSVYYLDGRKVVHFNKPSFDAYTWYLFRSEYFELAFIEGIGTTAGPFGTTPGYFESEYSSALLCVHQGDSLLYMANPEVGCYYDAASVENRTSQKKITLYPNPANDHLTISTEDAAEISGSIFILNTAGIVVYSGVFNNNSADIDISELSSGVYVLRLENKDGVSVKKFVKM